MSKIIKYVWIAANPSLNRFHNSLIHCLSQQNIVAKWEYYQHQDEPSSLEVALSLLEKYLHSLNQPVHLIGHSIGGTLGLLYADKYPEKVQSLTLLGVGFQPAVDWQTHYYVLRDLFPCSQEIILAHMVKQLFGYQNQYNTKGIIKILKQDLNTSPSPHSLFRNYMIQPKAVKPPLMVCGSLDDGIVDRNALRGWYGYFKENDVLWESPQGSHFFHYFYPEEVGRQIIKFWSLNSENQMLSQLASVSV